MAAGKKYRTSFLGALLDVHHEESVGRFHSRSKDPRPALLVALYSEHQYLLRLLEMLEELAQNLDETPTREVWTDLERAHAILQYLNVESDPRHHMIEERVADRLLASGAMEPEADRALKATHDRLMRKSKSLNGRLEKGLEQRILPADFETQVRNFANFWRRHIIEEERDLFPAAQKELRAEDWDAIETEVRVVAAPFFEGTISERYADIFQYLRERVIRIGGTSESSGLLQSASDLVEKLEVLSWGHEDFRNELDRHRDRIIAHQHKALGRLCAAKDVGSVVRGLSRWAGTTFNDAVALWRFPLAIVFRTGWTLIAPPRPPSRPEIKGAGRGAKSAESQGLGVGLINLVLRVWFKPMLRKESLDTLTRTLGTTIERFSRELPEDVRTYWASAAKARAEWIVPEIGEPSRVLLYLPGGAFLFPATQPHRRFAATLGRSIGARSLLVYYRLAPEHPFPAGLKDCIAAYRHLVSEGFDPKRIVIAGDSSGGGLTLSTLLALRDAGDRLPAAAVVISPLADLTYSGASRVYNRWRDPMLPTARAVDLHDLYLKKVPAEHPLVSPIFGDYWGFPPILAQVGSTEMLLDDTLRMAARARAQAVAVKVEIWRETPHAWHLMDFLPESEQATEHIAAFVRRYVPDIENAGIAKSPVSTRRGSRGKKRPKAATRRRAPFPA